VVAPPSADGSERDRRSGRSSREFRRSRTATRAAQVSMLLTLGLSASVPARSRCRPSRVPRLRASGTAAASRCLRRIPSPRGWPARTRSRLRRSAFGSLRSATSGCPGRVASPRSQPTSGLGPEGPVAAEAASGVDVDRRSGVAVRPVPAAPPVVTDGRSSSATAIEPRLRWAAPGGFLMAPASGNRRTVGCVLAS
jgi:hypothetical protein